MRQIYLRFSRHRGRIVLLLLSFQYFKPLYSILLQLQTLSSAKCLPWAKMKFVRNPASQEGEGTWHFRHWPQEGDERVFDFTCHPTDFCHKKLRKGHNYFRVCVFNQCDSKLESILWFKSCKISAILISACTNFYTIEKVTKIFSFKQ